ncbi:MAG: hypothetical protein AAFU85_18645 [Planctomycetota bacterium]
MTWTAFPVAGVRIANKPTLANSIIDSFAQRLGLSTTDLGQPVPPWKSCSPGAVASTVFDWDKKALQLATWRLIFPYSSGSFDVVEAMHRRICMEDRLWITSEIDWLGHGELLLHRPMRSFQRQEHSTGFNVSIEPLANPERDAEGWLLHKGLFKRLAESWGFAEQLKSTESEFKSENDRIQIPAGEVRIRHSATTIKYACCKHICEFQDASTIFRDALDVAVDTMGPPHVVVLSVQCFDAEFERCIRICESISSNWHFELIGKLNVDDIFVHPGRHVVFPYRWSEVHGKKGLADPFLDFQVSVEHTGDGKSNLLIHSNNDVDWIMNVLDDLGLTSEAAALREDEIYTDMSKLKV